MVVEGRGAVRGAVGCGLLALVLVAGPAAAVEEEPVFLPVEVRGDDAPTVPMACPADDPPHGRVQIVLATGHRMTVEGPFDGDAVGRLLSILARP